MRNLFRSVAPAILAFTPVVAMADPVDAPSPAAKPGEARPADASIPFANRGGVDNWRATDDRTVYFQDLRHNWYRATLFSSAFGLTTAEHIGIDAGPTGSLDKWGAIYVHGQRYAFLTFERIEGEPPRRRRR